MGVTLVVVRLQRLRSALHLSRFLNHIVQAIAPLGVLQGFGARVHLESRVTAISDTLFASAQHSLTDILNFLNQGGDIGWRISHGHKRIKQLWTAACNPAKTSSGVS